MQIVYLYEISYFSQKMCLDIGKKKKKVFQNIFSSLFTQLVKPYLLTT